ncbi:hypothetical protein BV898_13094 [Hypsibius exemplaris]|uniref:Uncharacterized protein n=1 Tax=Hypsibius exemplaris TaxID=2072580 RepID=A0A1W0WBU2_HYPEX|nr:hypothetical protein BV898_13094 [Hypsibius exemplaris]
MPALFHARVFFLVQTFSFKFFDSKEKENHGVFQPVFTASIAAGVALFFLGSPLVESLLLADIDNLNEIHNHNNKTQAIMDKLAFRQSLIVNSGNPVCSGPYYQGQLQDTAPARDLRDRALRGGPQRTDPHLVHPGHVLQRFMINPITGHFQRAQPHQPSSVNLTHGSIRHRVPRASHQHRRPHLRRPGQGHLITTPLPQVIVAIYNNTNGTTSPSFDSSTYSFTLTSCYPGARVGTVAASVSGSVGSFVQYYNHTERVRGSEPAVRCEFLRGHFPGGQCECRTDLHVYVASAESNGTGTAQVTVTTTCTNTGGGSGNVPFSPGTQAPTWASSSYTFGLGTCTPEPGGDTDRPKRSDQLHHQREQ